jgi:hypothetical protein
VLILLNKFLVKLPVARSFHLLAGDIAQLHFISGQITDLPLYAIRFCDLDEGDPVEKW